SLAGDDQLRTVLADPLDLGRRGNARKKDARGFPEPSCRIRDGDPVVAAGRGDDTRKGHIAKEHVGERTARLERARVLQQLQLEDGVAGAEPAVRAIDRDRWRAPDKWPDHFVGARDALPVDWREIHA